MALNLKNNNALGYKKFLRALIKEATKDKHKQNYFFMWINLEDYATYQDLKKNAAAGFKTGLTVYLLKRAVWHSRGLGFLLSASEYEPYLLQRLVRSILQSKQAFKENQIITLFKLYRLYAKVSRHHTIGWWPLGLTLKQIDYLKERTGLSGKMLPFLKEMIQWPELRKKATGFDPSPIKKKLQEMISTLEGEPVLVADFKWEKGDDLGFYLNHFLKQSQGSEQKTWLQIFDHASSANGSKPSKSFLSKSEALTQKLGPGEFKKRMLDFMDYFADIKEKTSVTKFLGQTYYSGSFLTLQNAQTFKGLLWSLASENWDKLLADKIAAVVERAFKKIPGVGPSSVAVGNAGIHMLGEYGGLDGAGYLSLLKPKIKQLNTKNILEKNLTAASQKLGISPQEIEEMSIPDFDLKEGRKTVTLAGYTLTMELAENSKVELLWLSPEGKEQKSPPAAIKNSEELSSEFDAFKKEAGKIQKFYASQKDRLDRLFIEERTWPYETFLKYYINHGLLSTMSRKLIWTITDGKNSADVLWQDGLWLNVAQKPLSWIGENCTVRLWHPVNAQTGSVLLWRNLFLSEEIKQPLKQAFREIYLLTDAEITTGSYSNRMAAHILKQHQFHALCGVRGWRYTLLGDFDGGGGLAQRDISPWNLHAEFWVNEVIADHAKSDAGIWMYVSTDQVRFLNANREPLDLAEVPKVVFSEVMRDVDLFVGVSSVGNDPEWSDGGLDRQYRDYWSSYSFGDLSEVAKVRMGVLENLLPKLKIRDVARIDGKFLVVTGKKRTYKIHIGSSNILMEPNDQYLCIVPARGGVNTAKIFLPFEGDGVLSLVISKALLLADDDKIKDSTIVRQINRQ